MLYLIISNCRLFCLSPYYKARMPSFILKRNHYLETFLLVVHINDKLPKTIRKVFFGLLRVKTNLGTRLALSDERHHDVWGWGLLIPLHYGEHQTHQSLSLLHTHQNATLTSGPRPRSWPSEGLRSRARAARACPWTSPRPRTGSTSLLECVSHNIERNHWSGGKKKKGERKWRRKERHKLSHSSPFGFFSSPKNTEEILFTPSFFSHWSEEMRKGPRFTWVATHPERQRRFSCVFIASRVGGGVVETCFFPSFFLLIGWTASHELVCVCGGGGAQGGLCCRRRRAPVFCGLASHHHRRRRRPPSVSIVSLLRISRSALV